jgi:hypothetical protein
VSEQQFRENAVRYDDYGYTCEWCLASTTGPSRSLVHETYCPVSDEPDLVKVLRFIKPMYDKAWSDEESLCGMVVGDTLLYILEYISDELGVRLTEDGGWEYLENTE